MSRYRVVEIPLSAEACGTIQSVLSDRPADVLAAAGGGFPATREAATTGSVSLARSAEVRGPGRSAGGRLRGLWASSRTEAEAGIGERAVGSRSVRPPGA